MVWFGLDRPSAVYVAPWMQIAGRSEIGTLGRFKTKRPMEVDPTTSNSSHNTEVLIALLIGAPGNNETGQDMDSLSGVTK